MKEHMKKFKKIFEQENLSEAIDYINHLKSNLNDFPKFLVEYLNKNFFPEHRKYLHFLEKDHKGKLDNTNNKIENYNKITMPRYEKKCYRTLRGLWSALMAKKDVWIEKRKMEHST